MLDNPIIIIIGLLIIFMLLRIVIDTIVSRITRDNKKQNIIGDAIIIFICLIGGIIYLAYSYLITKSQDDVRVAYWLVFSFILLTAHNVLDYVKYKRCSNLAVINDILPNKKHKICTKLNKEVTTNIGGDCKAHDKNYCNCYKKILSEID